MVRSHITLMVVGLSVAGCASLGKPTATPEVTFESQTDRAIRCLCLWQGGEAESSDGRGSRGFAGQLYFFTASNPSPVAVNGDLHVFVFDDVGSEDDQSRPIHEFDIPGHALQGFRKSTQLGPAYEIFVPYPRSGRAPANCSLRVRLARPDGSKVFSEMAEIKLPGPEIRNPVVQKKAHELPVAEELPQQLLTRSETIGVRENGEVLRASHTTRGNVSRADDSQTSAYERRIREFMNQQQAPREVSQRPVAAATSRKVLDSLGLEDFQSRSRNVVSPEVPETPRFEERDEPIEIHTLSRPLGREPARRFEAVPEDSAPIDLPMPGQPSAAAPVENTTSVLHLPMPEPFAPIGDQAAMDRESPFDIELPLPELADI